MFELIFEWRDVWASFYSSARVVPASSRHCSLDKASFTVFAAARWLEEPGLSPGSLTGGQLWAVAVSDTRCWVSVLRIVAASWWVFL